MAVKRVHHSDFERKINWMYAPAVPDNVLQGKVDDGVIVVGPGGQTTFIRGSSRSETRADYALMSGEVLGGVSYARPSD